MVLMEQKSFTLIAESQYFFELFMLVTSINSGSVSLFASSHKYPTMVYHVALKYLVRSLAEPHCLIVYLVKSECFVCTIKQIVTNTNIVSFVVYVLQDSFLFSNFERMFCGWTLE